MACSREQALKNLGGIRPGPGRPKGSVSKYTQTMREMILMALDEAGGVDYLVEQAHKNPGPFIGLLGKVLPMTVQTSGGEPLQVVIERRVVTIDQS